MKVNTFFQLCIYICIALIAVNISVAFVSTLNVFETDEDFGVKTGDNTTSTFSSFTGGFSIDDTWLTVLTVAGIFAVGVAIAMRSAIPVGAYLFSSVFWTAYVNSLGLLESLSIPPDFLLIGTVLMFFFWAGALAGMFGGSG